MADVLRAQGAGAVQNLRELIAQIRRVDHFLHVAQLIGPRAEIAAGDRPFLEVAAGVAAAIVHAAIKKVLALATGQIALTLVSAGALLIALLLAGLLTRLTSLLPLLLILSVFAALTLLLSLLV